MRLKDGLQDEYDQYVGKNQDPYGNGVIRYAESWADLMENALNDGKELKDVWKDLSHKADTEGITGFMHGCAVSALGHFWIYGDDLRKLHNKDYGVEEEKAKGGTVNPAILTVETKE